MLAVQKNDAMTRASLHFVAQPTGVISLPKLSLKNTRTAQLLDRPRDRQAAPFARSNKVDALLEATPCNHVQDSNPDAPFGQPHGTFILSFEK
jgi:hypothetical protein